MVSTRTTGTSASMLIIESLVGTIVAGSNLIMVLVIIAGWKKLMKVQVSVYLFLQTFERLVNKNSLLQYNFYVIVTNLTIFTSFKAFVELGFILPFYVMQSDGKKPVRKLQITNSRKNFYSWPTDTFHRRMNFLFLTFRFSQITV